MGHRPQTPDTVPVIDRSTNHSNVFYAFGHGHLGLTGGPSTGRLIAALVRDETPGIDMRPYRIDRFR
jgi:D-amino-acid dehydrogenase